ncbi:MAG TPA: DUF3662 and FHA domain-containing protein [Thermoleophilaceae bacterium]|nr:DUF3662 and FHA domain-containing protein [Thermoleophilaceae bacterium]
MSLLRNLESKLGGLVEGAFSRAFKSSVEPVELARKLAKEMEESKMASVSRTYVPNHYRVFLSPDDRSQFATYEPALRKELSDYLLEHARAESLALTSRPVVEFMTDERLALGEFGIQAQLLSPPEEEHEPASAAVAPSQGDFGHTMVYSPDRAGARALAPERPPRGTGRRAVLAGDGRRTVIEGERFTIGRSRDCDMVIDDPNISRHHCELRAEGDSWRIADLGSTNGIKVNRRRVDEALLRSGDRIALGLTDLDFELE